MKCIFVLFLLFLLLGQPPVLALQINEVYPAPSAGDEWTELYNETETSLDLSLFTLIDEKNNKIQLPPQSIEPHSYLIVSSSNILNNTGDSIFIKQGDSVLDQMSYQENPGDQMSYQKCAGNWVILPPTQSAPTNDNCGFTPSPSLTNTPTATIALTTTPTPPDPTATLAPGTILINEVMINPETGQNEWVELYNTTSNEIQITKWYLDDSENGSSSKEISFSIAAHAFAVVELNTSLFNNDSDEVRLLNSTKEVVDQTEYEQSIKNKTWGRSNGSFCFQSATKNSTNDPCINNTIAMVTPTLTTSPSLSPTQSELILELTPTDDPVSEILPWEKSLETNHRVYSSESVDVLGATTSASIKTKNSSIVSGLAITSASFSLLTIATTLLKIKLKMAS